MAERQIDVGRGPEARREQALDRLEDGEQACLVVEAAPAPHVAVRQLGGEGWMRPVALRARVDRNHVLVGEEHQRRRVRVAAGPTKEQAQIADQLSFEPGVHQRVGGREMTAEVTEGRHVPVDAVLRRDRPDAQAGPQPFDGAVRVDPGRPDRRRVGLP